MAQQARSDVRQRLVEAARVGVRRDGPDALTTRAVVAEAGVSTGALYHHFPSLDHLLAAVAEDELRAGVARAAAVDPGGAGGPLAWLVEAVVGDVDLAVTVASLRARAEAGEDGPAAVARVQAMVAATVGEVVAQARDLGQIEPTLDVEALVEVVDILWDGLGRRHARGLLRTSPDRVVATVARILPQGCAPRPSG